MKPLLDNTNPDHILELHKETVEVSKKEVVKAKYQIEKTTETEDKQVFISLKNKEVQIKEIVKEEELEDYPVTTKVGNTTIIPIIREEEVVIKKIILVKEIHITEDTTTEIKSIPVTSRIENVKLTKTE
ncbi:DUF2382 domain-containing protein [Aquimarina sp. ERC-38]|uniref:DUF2382 domain-containing protein n=1 Tax=Aquimarina sp. ERC-38 TaxID=2949996 RepID=UPI002245866C|nr:DUF2382 domain-containing protein [Aquimarina sp. ERC-38]UZO82057.1 DUF2382 domain-containing protein [Aquimarina sp. ERC-38]